MRRTTFEELLAWVQSRGISVRHAALGGTGGGLAQIRGKQAIFVDTDAEPEDQLERTVHAVRRLKGFSPDGARADVLELIRASGK